MPSNEQIIAAARKARSDSFIKKIEISFPEMRSGNPIHFVTFNDGQVVSVTSSQAKEMKVKDSMERTFNEHVHANLEERCSNCEHKDRGFANTSLCNHASCECTEEWHRER